MDSKYVPGHLARSHTDASLVPGQQVHVYGCFIVGLRIQTVMERDLEPLGIALIEHLCVL
jgi:hypothetical protein